MYEMQIFEWKFRNGGMTRYESKNIIQFLGSSSLIYQHLFLDVFTFFMIHRGEYIIIFTDRRDKE